MASIPFDNLPDISSLENLLKLRRPAETPTAPAEPFDHHLQSPPPAADDASEYAAAPESPGVAENESQPGPTNESADAAEADSESDVAVGDEEPDSESDEETLDVVDQTPVAETQENVVELVEAVESLGVESVSDEAAAGDARIVDESVNAKVSEGVAGTGRPGNQLQESTESVPQVQPVAQQTKAGEANAKGDPGVVAAVEVDSTLTDGTESESELGDRPQPRQTTVGGKQARPAAAAFDLEPSAERVAPTTDDSPDTVRSVTPATDHDTATTSREASGTRTATGAPAKAASGRSSA